MPKMKEKGKQIKVWLPQPLYDALFQESGDMGRPMAEIVREELAGRYQRQAEAAGLQVEVASSSVF